MTFTLRSSLNTLSKGLIFSFFSCLSFYALAQVQSANVDNVQVRQLLQLAEYVGVDYEVAVKSGEVINVDEYQEMLEFSSLIVEKTANQLPLKNNNLIKYKQLNGHAKSLAEAINNKKSVATVRQISAELRASLLALMPNTLLPKRLISKQNTQTLFQQHCSQCHGLSGQGDGDLAANLSPEPTDFTDKARAENRSLLGLFDAISNGLDDTAMPAFTQLKEQQRWSLAFYVGSLAFQSEKTAQSTGLSGSELSLQSWINLSPALLKQKVSESFKENIAALRASPQQLFTDKETPLAVTKTQLNAAFSAYKNKAYVQAKTLAVSAYLDGFELIENSLDARDKILRKSIEANLINLRHTLSQPEQEILLSEQLSVIHIQIAQAEQLLGGAALSNSALFSASLVILLREGLEAILVVIALMTVLMRTNRTDALKFVHIGWIGALIAGGLTWAAAQYLIDISGASREVMEGVAALLAAVMLLYVGIWMHSKTNAAQWQAYIQKHINSQLQSGTLWGLAALSFIAVYREVFETVLFYQSLLTQAETQQYSVVAAGFLVGGLILAVVAWSMLKYSVKLPIARFFAVTTYLLLALSFILMGKAVTALQEAAFIAISPLPVHIEFDWVGIGSTWQGMFAQLFVVLFFVFYMLYSKNKKSA